MFESAALSALFLPLALADIWVPTITFPTLGTILHGGDVFNVTWDISNPPPNVTNTGNIIIRSQPFNPNGSPFTNYAPVELASGFDLFAGKVDVQIPRNVTPTIQDYVVSLVDPSNTSLIFIIFS